MPLRQTTLNGKPAYQWGTTGKKYSYTPGNAAQRELAKRKALEQGKAIEAGKSMSSRPRRRY
jgi:hypothetical protein